MVINDPEPEHHERTVYAEFVTPTAPAVPSETIGEGDLESRDSDLEATTIPPVGKSEIRFGLEPLAKLCALPLYDNVHVIAPLPPGETRDDLLARARQMQSADPNTLDPFDLPERDRMYELATSFVATHVRQLRPGSTMFARNRSFGSRTLVISERAIPRIPFRVVRLTWAVDRGNVVDVRGHKVFAFRLMRLAIPLRRFIWAPGKGDVFDVAYVLGNLCAILGLRIPKPVAACGIVALQTNQIVGNGGLEGQRDAASHDGVSDMILPFATHLMRGMHEGVRYWPARDVNEAVFSMLSAACADVAIPDLKRRWRVKMVVSWVSLLAVLLAIGTLQLGGLLVGDPLPVRWTAGVSVGLILLSIWATHKYHRIDR
jgi:hypothetical protein